MRAFQPDNCRGAVAVIVAFSLVVLLGLSGLAIDAGMAYGVKAKLSAALDAAAIAAAKASSVGRSQPERDQNAKTAAVKFFAANFPDGYLGATPKFGKVEVATNGGRVTVDVSATADEPTLFMRVLGFDSTNVYAAAQVIRQDLDMAFVVDNTTSLRGGSLGDVTGAVITSAKGFIDRFNDSTDRVALVKYAYGAEVPVKIKTADRGFDKNRIKREIDRFDFGSGANSNLTNSSEGFWRARDQLEQIPLIKRSSIRAIVFFTDGAPNTFAATFAFNGGISRSGSVRSGDGRSGTEDGLWSPTAINTRTGTYNNFSNYVAKLPTYYDPRNSGDREFRLFPSSRRPTSNSVSYANINRISRNLLEDMAEAARKDGIYVFTLGLGSRLIDATGPDDEQGQDILLRMANDKRLKDKSALAGDYRPDQPSGLYCYAANAGELGDCYDRLASAIMRLSM